MTTVKISCNGLTLNVDLQGTNPEFGFIFINDVCYTLVKKGKTFQLKKYLD